MSLNTITANLPINPQSWTLREKTGLILVDMVNGFCKVGAGALAPPVQDPKMDRTVEECNRLAKRFHHENRPILAFRDSHIPGRPEFPYPLHCEQGSGEDQLIDELSWLENSPRTTIINKDCINGFIGAIDLNTHRNQLQNWIEQNALEHLLVVGVCTDICVMDLVLTLLSARNHGLTDQVQSIVVYEKGCTTYHLSGETAATAGLPKTAIHPQDIAHHTGLYMMASRGAMIASDIV